MTKLIERLTKKLTDEFNLGEKTIKNYITKLKVLNNNELPSSLDYLTQTDEIDKKINEYKLNTRITAYNILSKVLRASNSKKYKNIIKYYDDKMNEGIRERMKTENKKTETQEENWITWEEVQKVYNNIKKEANKRDADYEDILKYVVLSLYVLQDPRRNADYMNMYVVKKHNDSMDESKNYLDLKNKQFIFNNYKTAGVYGKQILDINKDLMRSINKYLKIHPLKNNKEFKFLVFEDGKEFNQDYHITRLLNRIFNKNIGSTMLRHIYISHHHGGEAYEKEKEMASKMGHNIGTQKKYILMD